MLGMVLSDCVAWLLNSVLKEFEILSCILLALNSNAKKRASVASMDQDCSLTNRVGLLSPL